MSAELRAPSSSALAHAPRTRDSAAASGIRRRSAWCHRSRVHASRESSTAVTTAGRAAICERASTTGSGFELTRRA